MLHRHFIGLAATFGIFFMSGNVTLAKDLAYPAVERGDVIDTYHGVRIADPYRWLENPEAPATREFVQRQNADDVAGPSFTGARRIVFENLGLEAPNGIDQMLPIAQFDGATDMGFLAMVASATGKVTADFWVLQIEDGY